MEYPSHHTLVHFTLNPESESHLFFSITTPYNFYDKITESQQPPPSVKITQSSTPESTGQLFVELPIADI